MEGDTKEEVGVEGTVQGKGGGVGEIEYRGGEVPLTAVPSERKTSCERVPWPRPKRRRVWWRDALDQWHERLTRDC